MKTVSKYFLTCLVVLTGHLLNAQICTTPKDTVYGLTSITGSSGQLVAININNGGTKLIGSPVALSDGANGLGFSTVNGRFYFFNQSGAGTTEFVSFNPLNNTKIAYSSPPLLPATQKIRSGTVNRTGSGYYTIYPGATTLQGFPVTNPAFYYFNIATTTWTRITQSFLNTSGTNEPTLKNLNSGDMAFDGNDNLWILCSNSTQYALYKIKAPVPTTAVASVTVDTIIPVTANPVSGVSFTGIAFNSQGKLYLTTGSGAGPGNNILYVLPTPGSPMTQIATLPNSYGDDLTSCSFPAAVLAGSGWADLSLRLVDNGIRLSWKIDEDDDVTGYDIEFSIDGSYWQKAGYVSRNGSSNGQKTYSYIHTGYNTKGNNYYRIVQVYANDKKLYSAIRYLSGRTDNKFYIGPNPANDVLYFYNNDNSTKQLAQVFDKSGRLVYSASIDPFQQSLNISRLSKGVYIIKLLTADGASNVVGYQFIKL